MHRTMALTRTSTITMVGFNCPARCSSPFAFRFSLFLVLWFCKPFHWTGWPPTYCTLVARSHESHAQLIKLAATRKDLVVRAWIVSL